MRPVRLDLEGFAAFREKAVIDFDGVDYFALVGPTGSGKSTLIDAIVFALYGTAPRWGRRNAIEYALAPTANRATVRLVFDLAGTRYAVAREVRRTGKTITQKTSSLDRLLDPDAVDGDAEVIAADPKAIASALEALIGLSYEDFTQCVVLPQGQFADFLKAKNADRQDILLKLLGADRYERIRKVAASRAAEARSTADALTSQLDGYTDATDDAIRAADTRVHDLAAGATRLAELAGRWTTAHQQAQTADTALTRARDDVTLLGRVRVPDGLTEAQAAAARTATALADADTAATTAAATHRQARSRLEEAPDPAPLTARRDQWRAHAEQLAARPGAEETLGQAQAAVTAAGTALADAGAAADQAQAAHRQAESHLEQAGVRTGQLTERRDTLRAVTVPADLDTLGDGLRAATQQDTDARAALDTAVTAEDAALTAAENAQDTAGLSRAVALAGSLSTLGDELAAAQKQTATAQQALTDAEERGRQARQADQAAEQALDRARTADLAAAVRAGLAAGDPCPVCGGTVHETSRQESAGTLDAATRARQQAATALDEARSTWEQARDVARTADAAETRLIERITQAREELTTLVPDGPTDPPGLQALLDRAGAAQEAVKQARAHTRQAREQATAAAQALQAARQAQAGVRTAYQNALVSCLPLGLTPPEGDDVQAGWRQLDAWRTAELATVTAELQRHQQVVQDATAATSTAREQAEAATAAREQAQKALNQAQVDEGAARTRLATLTDTLAGLDAALVGAPDLAATEAELTARDALARAEQAAYRDAQAAADTAATARAAHTAATAALTRSRDELTAQTRALAALDPPAPDPADLSAAWRTLTDWAAARSTQLQTDTLPALERDASAAQEQLTGLRTELGVLAADLQLPSAQPLEPHRVEVTLADVAARAQGQAATLRERATQRARLQQQVLDAQERHTVANQLADLLRANKFQGWLAGAALDTLVQGASDALLQLSGGQFDLTHEKGEFYVIDHTDADSLRSVKTLSGGETFQASLALALTLSEQLSSLQTTAAAKLDSIFLDEGFGTLDADSLDVVAATLEKLAESERMVGIVTHVGALADRVPVRFAVTRDLQGSRVTRVEEE